MSIGDYLWFKTVAEIVAIVLWVLLFVAICSVMYIENKRRRKAIKDICDEVRRRGPKLRTL